MNKHVSLLVAVLLVAAVVAGCSKGGSSSESGSAAPTAAANPSVAAGAWAMPAGLDAGPRAGDSPVDEAKAAAGEKLFSTKGCTACHAIGKKATGPDLAGVSKRRTAQWIEAQILHPDVMTKQDPISRDLFAKFMLQMPKQGLTPDEAAAVVEFFKQKDR